MDPKAALISLLESIAIKDWTGAEDALGDLEEWSGKGGYIPGSIHKALDALRDADD